MAFKLSSPFSMTTGSGSDKKPKITGKIGSDLRRQQYKDANYAPDHTTTKKKAKTVAVEAKKVKSTIEAPKASDVSVSKKPTGKVAPKTSREAKKEDRKNARKAKRNARLDKKIARQTKKGKEAGDGAEKGINSKALAKRRRVDKLKARKAKNNKK